MDLEYTHREDAHQEGEYTYRQDPGLQGETGEYKTNCGQYDRAAEDLSAENDEDQDPTRLRYDPVARYFYPPPYPREQGHGAGV
jgi:hypothetical protein